MTEKSISGKIWILLDERGHLIENIDTDQIFHNAHLHITAMDEMGKYAFGNLVGWKDFSNKAGPGDILVAARNFGAGSSRQQAVDCFRALGIGAILAPSFGAIYFRNAVNSGFPVLRSPEISRLVKEGRLATGDEVRVAFVSGKAEVMDKDVRFSILPMSAVQHGIYEAGGLYEYGRTLNRDRG